MINKRKKQLMDPTKINNYNNFLSTLDNSNNNNSEIVDINNENEIDNIIDIINNNFKIGNYSSVNFTGKNLNENCYVNDIDPNYYFDCDNEKDNKYLYKLNIPNIIPLKKKEPILTNIDVEINNISDILNLIETYKLDPDIKYNINMNALHNIKEPLEELNNMIGMKELKNSIVEQILYFVQNLHKNKNTLCSDFMHTVIYGPPGTGKTEISKIMGKIYSKIGVLTNGTFKKVTRSDLIAGYLGQTSLKTRDVIKEALGGVLFIDEAYSLGNLEKKDSFAKECIDTLCEALSDNKENLMVIIAGYEKELKDCFFNYNQGLDSRFTWRFKMDDYSDEDLYNIFLKKVKDIGWEIENNSEITCDWFKKNKVYFKYYGRDIETVLAKTKIVHSKRVFCKPENEKRKINLKDLDKGFEIYIKNDDVKNRRDELEMKKYIYNTIYS